MTGKWGNALWLPFHYAFFVENLFRCRHLSTDAARRGTVPAVEAGNGLGILSPICTDYTVAESPDKKRTGCFTN